MLCRFLCNQLIDLKWPIGAEMLIEEPNERPPVDKIEARVALCAGRILPLQPGLVYPCEAPVIRVGLAITCTSASDSYCRHVEWRTLSMSA